MTNTAHWGPFYSRVQVGDVEPGLGRGGPDQDELDSKVCARCLEVKFCYAFDRSAHQPGGWADQCKQCAHRYCKNCDC